MLTTACNRQQKAATEAQLAEQKANERIQAADSLINYLSSQIPAIGFSTKAFHLDSIAGQRASLQGVDIKSDNAKHLMDVLEYSLLSIYLDYAKGLRFGFMNPNEAFNKDFFDDEVEQPDSLFNEEALQAFKDFKACDFLQKCQPQSKAYQQLLAAYQEDSTSEGRERIALNMERLRWHSKKAPAPDVRHLFVNIAAQQVWAIDTDSVFSMRICCGAPGTKTPLLTSTIHLIQVNPEWNIPYSIIRGEVSRRAGDSAYFARNNYYITDRQGKRVNPKEVTSSQLSSGGYRIAQRSGAGNSLGRIIFRFDNRFAVYLHDTSNKSAFNNERRTISHGCVRLQRPFDVAKFVVPHADPWTLDKIRLSMDMTPETEKGQDYVKAHGSRGARLISSLDVEPQVPVIISYFTTYPNPETGIVETWPDRYSFDPIIKKGLKPFLP